MNSLPCDQRNRADDARKRLGVTKEQIDGTARITPLLREIGFTLERVIEVLEGDDSSDARIFTTRCAAVSSSDRAYLSVEEIAIASGLTPRRLWEVLSGARLTQAQDATKFIISDAMPQVVQKAIKAATDSLPILDGQGQVQGWTNGDIKAMEFLGKVSGLMPTPKGAVTVFNVGNNGPLPSEQAEVDELPLQDMDSTLKQIQQVTAIPQLEAPKETVPFIPDVEFEDVPLEG